MTTATDQANLILAVDYVHTMQDEIVSGEIYQGDYCRGGESFAKQIASILTTCWKLREGSPWSMSGGSPPTNTLREYVSDCAGEKEEEPLLVLQAPLMPLLLLCWGLGVREPLEPDEELVCSSAGRKKIGWIVLRTPCEATSPTPKTNFLPKGKLQL